MNICQPKPVPLPDDALLWRYRGKQGHYTDCYACTVEGPVEFGTFVFSFYTTWLFRCERLILKLLVKRPSTDHDASSLASGASKTFAAWTVEARSTDEILMCDMAGRTRSWLKVEQLGNNKSRLMFGSAVVPKKSASGSSPDIGFIFRALLGFHKLYSRALLATAASRIRVLK